MNTMLPFGSKPQVSGFWLHWTERDLFADRKPRHLKVCVERDEVFEMLAPPHGFKGEPERLSELRVCSKDRIKRCKKSLIKGQRRFGDPAPTATQNTRAC